MIVQGVEAVRCRWHGEMAYRCVKCGCVLKIGDHMITRHGELIHECPPWMLEGRGRTTGWMAMLVLLWPLVAIVLAIVMICRALGK